MTNTPPTATWRVLQVELALGEPEALLRGRAAERAGIDPAHVRGMRVARKALDARRRGGERRLKFVCSVDLVVDASLRSHALRRAERAGRVKRAPKPGRIRLAAPHASIEGARAVVVGSGPAGLFAALALATNGARVELLERGPAIEDRGPRLVRFHRTREVDREGNLLFGEGGAGTYSDGKIYTRVDDPLEVPLLEELVACGAPPAITYDALAHIGTDKLHRILPRFRARLEALGVTFRFETRFEGLVLDPNDAERVRAVRTSAGEVPCDALVVAIGHSARDTWRRLADDGVRFEPKPFQLGLRIEHPQDMVDRGRYGGPSAVLGPASYNLVCRGREGVPGAHTFCMCPGGRIVASVNEPGGICTNGMSNSKHSSGRATAAIVATVRPESFGAGPFDGVRLQRDLEERFFAAGGGDYAAPAQRASDYLARRASSGPLKTTWTFGTTPARLDELLPIEVATAIGRALEHFDRQLPGFAGPDGVLVGPESRSSGPVRAPRQGGARRAVGFRNLCLVGEGAGYAGGIMSAALDGAHAGLELARDGLSGGAC